jgi:hypothetical protein
LFGRGAGDDKGQLFMHIKTMEAFFALRKEAMGEGEKRNKNRGLPRVVSPFIILEQECVSLIASKIIRKIWKEVIERRRGRIK